LSILLAFVAFTAGAPKLVLEGTSAQLQSHMGRSPGLVRFIEFAEVSATVGFIVGLFWRPLGIAAAIGVAALLIGAVGFHAKGRPLFRPEDAQSSDLTNRAVFRGRRRRSRTHADNVTELTATLVRRGSQVVAR
jgi:hypothetical protein